MFDMRDGRLDLFTPGEIILQGSGVAVKVCGHSIVEIFFGITFVCLCFMAASTARGLVSGDGIIHSDGLTVLTTYGPVVDPELV